MVWLIVIGIIIILAIIGLIGAYLDGAFDKSQEKSNFERLSEVEKTQGRIYEMINEYEKSNKKINDLIEELKDKNDEYTYKDIKRIYGVESYLFFVSLCRSHRVQWVNAKCTYCGKKEFLQRDNNKREIYAFDYYYYDSGLPRLYCKSGYFLNTNYQVEYGKCYSMRLKCPNGHDSYFPLGKRISDDLDTIGEISKVSVKFRAKFNSEDLWQPMNYDPY
jgi:hypothetical protein